MNTKIKNLAIGVASALSIMSAGIAYGGSVTLTNTFTADSPAVAAEVNQNFGDVKTAVDDNDARISALEAQIATLQDTVDQLSGANGFSASTLSGTYTAVIFETALFADVDIPGGTGAWSSVGTFVFDGSGNLTSASIDFTDAFIDYYDTEAGISGVLDSKVIVEEGTDTFSGTYTVLATGQTTINVPGTCTYNGQVSRSGDVAVIRLGENCTASTSYQGVDVARGVLMLIRQ